MNTLDRFLKILLVLSVILLVLSYFQKNKLPQQGEIKPELMQDPLQTPTSKKPFEYSQKNVTYTITPQYDYSLYGLVVSQNDNEVWYSRFKKTDPSNTKDYCVLWGKNLSSGIYQKMTFKTEEFVCLINYPQNEPRNDAFSMTNLSNNHLLTADENVYKAIRSASVGDQIHLKGYLINYQSVGDDGKKMSRGTSIVRVDTGEGACETIYVEQFEIIQKGNILWWSIYKISPYAVAVLSFLIIILFIISTIISSRSKPSKLKDMPNRDILLPKNLQ